MLRRTPLRRTAFKRIDKKTLEERIEKAKLEAKKDVEFYIKLWGNRPHICGNCGCNLGKTANKYNFDHILEKNKYPQFRHEEKNIWFLCLTCHDNKSRGRLSERMKQKILYVRGLLLKDD